MAFPTRFDDRIPGPGTPAPASAPTIALGNFAPMVALRKLDLP
jgi:hypothetical protein